MALLDQTQYGSILFAANKFKDVQDITDHFLAEYRKNIADNPRFLEKLKELIQSTKLKVDDLRKQGIARDKKAKYKNPDGSPMEKNDYKSYRYSTNQLGFGFIQFHGGSRISLNKINDVEKAFEQLTIKVVEMEGKETDRKIKLKWKGSKVQLYHVIRQLKNDYEMIGNSYNELADFLILNVISFENTGKETVEKELKKKRLPPKNKRLNIDIKE